MNNDDEYDDRRHLTEEERVDWLANLTPPGARPRLQKHLDRCSTCRERLEAEREVSALLAALPEVEAPRSFGVRKEPRHAVLARAASLSHIGSGIAAGFLVLLLGVDMLAPPPVPAARPEPRVRVAETNRPAAPTSEPLPYLEQPASGIAKQSEPAAAAEAADSDQPRDAAEAPPIASTADRERQPVRAMGTPTSGLEAREQVQWDWSLRPLELVSGGLAVALGLLGLLLRRLSGLA